MLCGRQFFDFRPILPDRITYEVYYTRDYKPIARVGFRGLIEHTKIFKVTKNKEKEKTKEGKGKEKTEKENRKERGRKGERALLLDSTRGS